MSKPDGAVRLMPDENLLEGRRHHAVSQLLKAMRCTHVVQSRCSPSPPPPPVYYCALPAPASACHASQRSCRGASDFADSKQLRALRRMSTDVQSRCYAMAARWYASTGTSASLECIRHMAIDVRLTEASSLASAHGCRRCSHISGPLGEDGEIEELGGVTCIKCPWHCRRVRLSDEGLFVVCPQPACRRHVTEIND